MNRCLETYLRCLATDTPKLWAQWLPWAEYCYNTTYHIAAGMTPFRVVYGHDPPTLLPFLWGSTPSSAIEQQLSGCLV